MKQPLRGPALYKAIRDYIKQFIIENELNAGDPLPPEGQLVEDLGVGRSSVREAVKSLQSLGIVDVRPGDGLYVRELNFDPMLETFQFGMQFDPQSVAELLQIRIWLEMAVIGDAVKSITSDEISRLDKVMLAWEQRLAGTEEYIDLDEEFHRIVYAVLDNTMLMKLFDVFWIAFLGLESDSLRESDAEEELRCHKDILQAIKARDTDLTRTQLLNHFEPIRQRIEEYIRNPELINGFSS